MAVIEKSINHLVNTSERSGVISNALIKDASHFLFAYLPVYISEEIWKERCAGTKRKMCNACAVRLRMK